jgi:hypothetical protein
MSVCAVRRTGLYKNTWIIMFNEYLGTAKKHLYVKMCKTCGVFIYTKNKLYDAKDIEFIERQPSIMIARDINGYCPTCYKIAREYNQKFESYPIG